MCSVPTFHNLSVGLGIELGWSEQSASSLVSTVSTTAEQNCPLLGRVFDIISDEVLAQPLDVWSPFFLLRVKLSNGTIRRHPRRQNTCVVSSANAAMTESIIDRESTSVAAINSDRQTEQNQ